MWKKLLCFFSPLRTLSILLIALATLDHLYNPFLHRGVDNSLPELILRTLFLFCGLYGTLGNGKHIQIRASIVGFPFIYLATIYSIELYKSGVQAIVIPLAFSAFFGIWTMIFGAYNEYRTRSLLDCISNRHSTKPIN